MTDPIQKGDGAADTAESTAHDTGVRGIDPAVPVPVLLLAHTGGRFSADRVRLDGQLVVGRRSAADWAVQDSRASGRHFRITCSGGRAVIEDLQSTNGTYLNGCALTGVRPLCSGDVIRAGQSLFVYQADGLELLSPKPERCYGMAGRFHVAPLLRRLSRIAGTNAHVLLSGPTGAGKELAARAISALCHRGIVVHSCAKFGTEEEAATTLFGVAAGIFSGVSARVGLIESADGKILFLDETHHLPQRLQKSLLRVVEDRLVSRIGTTAGKQIDVRFVFASNDLSETYGLVHDLAARVAVVHVPSLRERVADLPAIFGRLLRQALTGVCSDAEAVLEQVTVHHYEALCLNGFERTNTRGLIKIANEIAGELRLGSAPVQAVAEGFRETMARNTPGAQASELDAFPAARPSPTSSDTLRQIAEASRVSVSDLLRIREAYDRCQGLVTEMDRYLRERHFIRLSRTRLAGIVDRMALPRMRRHRGT